MVDGKAGVAVGLEKSWTVSGSFLFSSSEGKIEVRKLHASSRMFFDLEVFPDMLNSS